MSGLRPPTNTIICSTTMGKTGGCGAVWLKCKVYPALIFWPLGLQTNSLVKRNKNIQGKCQFLCPNAGGKCRVHVFCGSCYTLNSSVSKSMRCSSGLYCITSTRWHHTPLRSTCIQRKDGSVLCTAPLKKENGTLPVSLNQLSAVENHPKT